MGLNLQDEAEDSPIYIEPYSGEEKENYPEFDPAVELRKTKPLPESIDLRQRYLSQVGQESKNFSDKVATKLDKPKSGFSNPGPSSDQGPSSGVDPSSGGDPYIEYRCKSYQ